MPKTPSGIEPAIFGVVAQCQLYLFCPMGRRLLALVLSQRGMESEVLPVLATEPKLPYL